MPCVRYPNHCQNFTLAGHQLLFERAGFKIKDAGVDLGPVNAIIVLIWVFIMEYFPALMRRPTAYLWITGTYIFRPLDRYLGRRKNSYVIASTTYVLASKQ